MKTRRIVPLVLVLPLLAGFLPLHQPRGQSVLAVEPVPDKGTQDPRAPECHWGPHTCPILPIETYGDGSLYEAQRFADNTCNPPTLTYIFGIFTYPQTCPSCLPYYTRKDRSENKQVRQIDGARPFYGMPAPVPADYDHTMPAGKPTEYTKPALTPDRIRYLYLKQDKVYVRVFARLVNRQDMEDGVEADPANFTETIYFAFECSNPASVGEDLAQIKPVEPANQKAIHDPCGAPTSVYDVTYQPEDGTEKVHILTVLCGNPEPLEPEVRPVPAEQTETQGQAGPEAQLEPEAPREPESRLK